MTGRSFSSRSRLVRTPGFAANFNHCFGNPRFFERTRFRAIGGAPEAQLRRWFSDFRLFIVDAIGGVSPPLSLSSNISAAPPPPAPARLPETLGRRCRLGPPPAQDSDAARARYCWRPACWLFILDCASSPHMPKLRRWPTRHARRLRRYRRIWRRYHKKALSWSHTLRASALKWRDRTKYPFRKICLLV